MLASTLVALLTFALNVYAAPILVERGIAPSKLAPAKAPARAPAKPAALPAKGPGLVASKIPPAQTTVYQAYAAFASVAYCSPAATLKWTCPGCRINSGFKTVASGGDGVGVQYWYVGYDTRLKSVVVAHQGTDPKKIVPLLTDAKIFHKTFDPKLFPGFGSAIHGHQGFVDEHAKTAAPILAAVQKTMAQFKSTSVLLTGHSLGAALATIEGVYLPLHIKGATFKTVVFSSPRVGNEAFANYVDAHGGVTRVNNKHDLVTIIPGRGLGYKHAGTELHIQTNGDWVTCPGQDSTAVGCSVNLVPNISAGNIVDHNGPFVGVKMGAGC